MRSITIAFAVAVAITAVWAPAARAEDFAQRYDGKSWTLTWGGYLHLAYRWVEQPTNFNLAGNNNGFALEQARLGAQLQYKDMLAVRVSFEGASEDRVSQSFVGGTLTARLRDAYLTWAPLVALRVSAGQMVTPSDLDSMRSDAELPFVSRPIPIEGVQPSEGRPTLGMGTDRSIGLSIHSGDIRLGDVASLRYAGMVANNNGQNQSINSNNLPAIFGRFEFALWGPTGPPPDRIAPIRARSDDGRLPWVGLGLNARWVPRTAGEPPNLVRETDTGYAGDVIVGAAGIDLQAGLVYVKTVHDTLSSTPPVERFGWWAHLRYTIPRIPVLITPGYRIASYAPAPTCPRTAAPSLRRSVCSTMT